MSTLSLFQFLFFSYSPQNWTAPARIQWLQWYDMIRMGIVCNCASAANVVQSLQRTSHNDKSLRKAFREAPDQTNSSELHWKSPPDAFHFSHHSRIKFRKPNRNHYKTIEFAMHCYVIFIWTWEYEWSVKKLRMNRSSINNKGTILKKKGGLWFKQLTNDKWDELSNAICGMKIKPLRRKTHSKPSFLINSGKFLEKLDQEKWKQFGEY